ncbi:MAG: MGMT family protein [Candidatus Omnitrophota bacterium]
MKNWQKQLLNILKDRGFSEFDISVYKSVLEIPAGQTRSYSQIAEQIKRPEAVRAVANTLKKNPFTVIIPCHRVIKKDGKLGGYNRGEELKKQLLELEANSSMVNGEW